MTIRKTLALATVGVLLSTPIAFAQGTTLAGGQNGKDAKMDANKKSMMKSDGMTSGGMMSKTAPVSAGSATKTGGPAGGLPGRS